MQLGVGSQGGLVPLVTNSGLKAKGCFDVI